MSSVNFNGSIGKANVNTGDGTQVTGDGANVNTGAGTINVGGQTFGNGSPPTVPEVFDAIGESLMAMEAAPDAQPVSDTDSTVTEDDSGEEVKEAILRPLQTFAELPAEEQKQPEKWEQAQSLISRLVPYAPQIGKGLAVFGEAALSALANRNPIVAGILAVCKTTNAQSSAS